jgi:hypothetical protein
MRRLLIAIFAWLLGVALIAPSAQAATRYRYFQDHALDAGHASIWMIVAYKDTHGNRKFTPRWVLFNFRAPTSCQVGGNPLIGGSSPGYTRVTKLNKGKLTYKYWVPVRSPTNDAHSAGKVTVKVIKKTKRVEGTVRVTEYTQPPTYVNCTSGDAIPYFATPCRETDVNPPLIINPPYINPSLPVCTPA